MKEKCTCEICGMELLKSSLNKHIINCKFRKEHGYVCDRCGKKFEKLGSYCNHRGICGQTKIFKCEKCGKEFDNRSKYAGHKGYCTGNKISGFEQYNEKQRTLYPENYTCLFCGERFYKKKKKTYHEEYCCEKNPNRKNEHTCRFCGKGFGKKQLGAHVTLCKFNPNREKTIEKISNSRNGQKLSEQHKEKLSLSAIKAMEEGRQVCGRCKRFDYKRKDDKVIKVQGSWELHFAKFLDSKSILWEKNFKWFKYVYQEKIHRYCPDFYIKNHNVYVEVKGEEGDKDHAKWDQFPEKLLIVRQKELNNLDNWFFEKFSSMA